MIVVSLPLPLSNGSFFFYVGSIIKIYTYIVYFLGELSKANAGVGVALTQLLYMCMCVCERVALCVPCAAELIHTLVPDWHTHTRSEPNKASSRLSANIKSKANRRPKYNIHTYPRRDMYIYSHTYRLLHVYIHTYTHIRICSHTRTQSAYLVCSKHQYQRTAKQGQMQLFARWRRRRRDDSNSAIARREA